MSTNAVGWCAHQPADALQQLQRVFLVQRFRRPRRHEVLQMPKDGRGGRSGWRSERLGAVARGLHQRGDGVQQVEQRPPAEGASEGPRLLQDLAADELQPRVDQQRVAQRAGLPTKQRR